MICSVVICSVEWVRGPFVSLGNRPSVKSISLTAPPSALTASTEQHIHAYNQPVRIEPCYAHIFGLEHTLLSITIMTIGCQVTGAVQRFENEVAGQPLKATEPL